MAGIKIKRNDRVEVIAGKDKGKQGRVLACSSDKNRVLVEGVMMVKKHVKPNPQRNIKGGIAEQEATDSRLERDARWTRKASAPASAAAWKATEASASRAPPAQSSPTRRSKQHSPTTVSTDHPTKRYPPRRPWRKRTNIMAARLKEKYPTEIRPAIAKELGITNAMAVPRLEKIVINMGLGEATQNVKIMDPLLADLAAIAGQKPVTTKAKKSIAAFKVREGMPIGAMVTLRGERMYEFLDRLISIALPRVRDFRGVSSEVVRRPRQLHARPSRSADLPRDRLRQGRQDQGHERHDRHHRRGRQRRPRLAQSLRHAVPPGRISYTEFVTR